MKKTRRAFLVITILLSIILSSLIGCSSKKGEETKSTVNQASQESTATKDSKYGNVKGCLWKVKKGNATVYLYGSIHIAKSDMYPFAKPVEDAFEGSKNLVVETDVSDETKMVQSQSKLLYPENDNVYNHLTKEGKEKINAYAKELGINMDLLAKVKLGFISSIFQQAELQKTGYSANDGVDMYFLNKAKGKKKVLELESFDFQIDLLNSFSDKEQEKLFFSDIKEFKNCDAEFKKMYDAYKDADEKILTEMLINDSKEDEEFYKKMFVDRNVGMANKIDGYLKTNDSYFVVVGLGHFLGDDSVIKLLEKKGYTVTKL